MSAKKRKGYPAGQISIDFGDLRPRIQKIAAKNREEFRKKFGIKLSLTATVKFLLAEILPAIEKRGLLILPKE